MTADLPLENSCSSGQNVQPVLDILCASNPDTIQVVSDICKELGHRITIARTPDEVTHLQGHFDLVVVDVNLKTQPQFNALILSDLVLGNLPGLKADRGLMVDVLEDHWGHHRAFVFSCSGYCRLGLEENGRLTEADKVALKRSIIDILSMPPYQQATYYDYVTDSMIHSVVESSLAPIIVFRRSGPIWFANLAAQAVFKRPTHMMKGLNVDELLASRDAAPLFWDFVEQVARKPGDSSEFRMKARDGEEFDALIVVNRIFAPDIPPDSLGFTIYDITERKQAEAEITRLKSFYEQILHDLPAQVSVLDPEGRYLYVNPSGVSNPETRRWLFGRTDEEYGAKRSFGPEFGERRRTWLKEVEKTKSIGHFEESIPTPEGEMKHFIRMVRPVLDEKGTLTHFIRYGLDVTDSKRAMEAVQDAFLRFESVIEKTPLVAIQGFNRQGVIRHWNSASRDLYGYEKQEVLGRRIQEAILTKDGVQQFEKTIEQIWATGQGTTPGEWQITTRKGLRRWVYSTMFPIFRDGKVDEVFCMDVDITDRKRAEEERIRLEAQVQHAQKLESLGVLAGGIAHDFNNLLMGILGYASLALMEMPVESPARDSIEKIEVAGRRAAELTKQMLAYSGKGRFVVQAIDFSSLVEEMVHLLEVSVSKSAVLKYNLSRNLPFIEADATQLRQVVMNLITNASDAIGEKSGIITITTGAMECDRTYLTETYLDDNLPEGVYVYVEVSDTGCGMEPDTRARIFDPFFSTKFTGRGLGLAAVLGIVRGHRGALKVYSEPDRGSTFKVLFPAATVASESMQTPQVEVLADGDGGVVLVIDDEETVRIVAKQMLERCGYNVLTAADGIQGLEIYRQNLNSIDAVLLDMTMPHLRGDEVFREIRRINNNACVILSSGYNEQDATDRFAGKGLAGFIQKPYRVSELAEKIRLALNQAKSKSNQNRPESSVSL